MQTRVLQSCKISVQLDKSKLWAKHQASLKGNKALEKAHAQLGKKEKGIAAWKSLLEKEA